MDVLLDVPDASAAQADSVFDHLPFPAVIIDGALLVLRANTAARARLDPPPAEDDPFPPLDTVLARSGRIPTDVRLRILSCCGAEVRAGDGHGKHDALFALTQGHAIALFTRPLGHGRWMVILEERRGHTDGGGFSDGGHRDSLTEIAGRQQFEIKLTDALTDEDPDSRPAVVVFDIDRFRLVNDRLGRKGGDALLRAVAGRVLRAVREADHVARLEGDTFAVLQNNGQAADSLASRLVDLLGRPYLVRGEVATIGVSAGVARAPEDGASADTLLRHADYARREAKESGGQTWRRFGQSMADRARGRQELEADLRRALAFGQISLAYQARANLRTRAVTGFEALARWTHPRRGTVPPSLFIPVAEDAGLIGQIGEWVLRTACQEAATWPEPLTVAVNVSARQLDNGQHFVTQVVAALRESGLPARRLELELTEATLAKRADEAPTLLRDLHELGVRLSLDEFGSAEASLQRPRTFPFDTIKIGQSLIRSLDSSNDSGAVVRAAAALGGGLGMAVVAVGVETIAQARMVEADGCTEVQGWLIGRPVPADGIAAQLVRDLDAVLLH